RTCDSARQTRAVGTPRRATGPQGDDGRPLVRRIGAAAPPCLEAAARRDVGGREPPVLLGVPLHGDTREPDQERRREGGGLPRAERAPPPPARPVGYRRLPDVEP